MDLSQMNRPFCVQAEALQKERDRLADYIQQRINRGIARVCCQLEQDDAPRWTRDLVRAELRWIADDFRKEAEARKEENLKPYPHGQSGVSILENGIVVAKS